MAITIDALLGAGALARGWSSYLAVLCNQPSDRYSCGLAITSMLCFRLRLLIFNQMVTMGVLFVTGRTQSIHYCTQSCRFIVHSGTHELDFVAFGIIVAVFLLIAWGLIRRPVSTQDDLYIDRSALVCIRLPYRLLTLVDQACRSQSLQRCSALCHECAQMTACWQVMQSSLQQFWNRHP